MAVYASVTDLIGNTPIVDISALSPNPRVRILAKLEGQNPGGSVKDRAAKWMIEAAEASGELKPGMTVLESSSGNTGIALAMICKMKGYPFKVVLPENVSEERRQALEVWGGPDLLNRKIIVRPRESIEWTRRFTELGLFVGISSGAILAGAAKAANEIQEGTIVTIVCDSGWKYLSTGVWTLPIEEVEKRAKATIYF